MLEKALFFALGYYLGSRSGREGLGELIDVAKSFAKTDEFNTAAGMAVSTVRSVIQRGDSVSETSDQEWWAAATR